MKLNRQIRLKSRPVGMPQRANFDIVDAQLPEARDGEVLAKNLWLMCSYCAGYGIIDT
jgi:NADPH-dependent curcumin reductase CurA